MAVLILKFTGLLALYGNLSKNVLSQQTQKTPNNNNENMNLVHNTSPN
jgi:hypothetical protein